VLPTEQETCWTLIRAAAAGQSVPRDEFSRRYLPVARAYLAARWKNSPMLGEIDDAVQEVFLACFRQGGALARVGPKPGSGFRSFLFGVVRNVALHMERTHARRHRRQDGRLPTEVPGEAPAWSRIYDQAYARAIMREAADLMAARAKGAGDGAARRVDLLRVRFHDGMPIRDIARLWQADPDELHREYATARREFKVALREVVGLAERCAPEQLAQECDRLLDLLGS
jgi:RNA polymerase sigma factor (sigma-70 family)